MHRLNWFVAGTMVVLGACSTAQPVSLSEGDLNAMLSKGAQFEYTAGASKGTLLFFGDKTVSREVAGSNQIDDGTWRVADGKLCITWKTPAAAESCLTQVKVGSRYEARNADGTVAMTYAMK
jgi:hypothetical protein